jgi:hypothetical protein
VRLSLVVLVAAVEGEVSNEKEESKDESAVGVERNSEVSEKEEVEGEGNTEKEESKDEAAASKCCGGCCGDLK